MPTSEGVAHAEVYIVHRSAVLDDTPKGVLQLVAEAYGATLGGLCLEWGTALTTDIRNSPSNRSCPIRLSEPFVGKIGRLCFFWGGILFPQPLHE